MEYYEITLIDEELAIIQQSAISSSHHQLRNDEELTNIVLNNGIQYVEDYLDEEYLAEFKSLDSQELEEQDILDPMTYVSTSMSYKDRVQETIVNDLINYQYTFNIIGLDIKDKDWDLLFDVTYDYYHKNHLETIFLEDMRRLNRFAISLSLLKTSLVDISCYMNGLNYLESDYLKESDIIKMKERMNQNIQHSKVVDCSQYRKKYKPKNESFDKHY